MTRLPTVRLLHTRGASESAGLAGACGSASAPTRQTAPNAQSQALPIAHVLGVPVHVIGGEEAIGLMEQWIEQRDGLRWIALTGSHGVVEGYKHPQFQAILESAALSLPDGKWTARLAGWRGGCAPRQVRGTDLLWKCCESFSPKGYRHFFYGDTEEVLALMTRQLRERFPTLQIAGTYSPPFRELTPNEDTQIANLINAAAPDVLWVGLGLPKQERWIYEHRHCLHVPVVVAVGAAFKFASGAVKSAPPWASDWGLEWAWRFAHEPRRLWHRVVIYGPQFVTHALLELSGLKKYE